jgi:alanyl-tRNA synthetase
VLGQAAALFSTEAQQVPALIARLQAENKALQRITATLQEALLQQRARALLTESVEVGSARLIAAQLSDLEPSALRTLVQLLQEDPQVVALLVGVHDDKATVLFARGSAVNLHAGDLLRQTLQHFGGGGGGRPDFAQGGGVDPTQADAIIDFARTHAAQELSA